MQTLPNHVAIIPDGNRRWAREHNLPTLEGHRRGFSNALKLAKKIRSLGISTLTLWAFSTENWNRSAEEISYLMKLYELYVDRQLKDALKEEIHVTHLGRKDRLPDKLMKKIDNLEEKTKKFDKFFFNFALDYGGRNEIVRAILKMHKEKFNFGNFSEEKFIDYLDTKDTPHPNPDLIIRSGKEQRLSGFMTWQAAYAEYKFIPKHFPAITEKDVENAVVEFGERERRFGK